MSNIMESKDIRVGIADLNIVSSPDRIITIGLGSCVGIALYDNVQKKAGLSHIMLPDSTAFTNIDNPYKYPDLAIPILLEKMIKSGCNKRNIVAKIAGGASMFDFSDKSMISNIGERNGIAVKKVLNELDITIQAEDLGGKKGRTMIVESSTGIVNLKILGSNMIQI